MREIFSSAYNKKVCSLSDDVVYFLLSLSAAYIRSGRGGGSYTYLT